MKENNNIWKWVVILIAAIITIHTIVLVYYIEGQTEKIIKSISNE